MTLTPKESSLLSDLKSQEQLCITKYEEYSERACDPALKNLFFSLAGTERTHLDTINKILGGEEVRMPASPPSATGVKTFAKSECNQESKQNDAFLCKDALSMEKHVSGVYNTSVFEFTSPVLRDTLAHIQKEEQNHGEELYNYLSANGMYST
ncbi:MAG: spore coat protein [Clostridia bacterium]|nr:spore coat protein [Clostridia bacterium]